MEIGIVLDLRNPAQWERSWKDHYARSLELCEEADRLGMGGLWFTEHHAFDDGYLPQPLTFAAAVAARTSRARIGTSVLLAALRHPVQLAEEAALVDLISGGRLELGLGAGYRVHEYNMFDAEFTKRYTSTERVIAEVQRLWRQKEVTPVPLQDPLPMWGGFFGPRGARVAGRLGMGLLHTSAELLEPYSAGLAEGGHDVANARMSGLIPIMLADDPEAAWPRVAPHLAHQRNSYQAAAVVGTGNPPPPPVTPEEMLKRRGKILGKESGAAAEKQMRRRPKDPYGELGALEILTPEAAADRIRGLVKDVPVQHLIFWGSIGAMPDDLVVRHIELLSGRLAPLLR
ncbi:LLM class flavin-dependent oxidoreductase [Streptomyces sp. RLB3-6]|uniref:LLM class flavin-dependent oxidoreductase n=1 Tax=Streptomyces sp. RLB3-6 TaxID=2594457 RepID=UPI001161D7CF|nr:LLM class flavin-dependent oxidoreductase [Streptomyces sp. RLB3-6]QDN85752.1 LLM class flavin-dependent oxidoreductase [Streptomyces sp. RLB3-6]